MINLLPGEKFRYGNKLFSVVNAWKRGGKSSNYDIIDSDGVKYTRSAKVIHERIKEGLITFV